METPGLCVGGQGESGMVYELRDGEATGIDQRAMECFGLLLVIDISLGIDEFSR